MGEGRPRWSVAVWGRRWRGRHRGHFQIPCGIVRRGGRRQSICHPALHILQRSIWRSSNGLWHTWQWISSEGGGSFFPFFRIHYAQGMSEWLMHRDWFRRHVPRTDYILYVFFSGCLGKSQSTRIIWSWSVFNLKSAFQRYLHLEVEDII